MFARSIGTSIAVDGRDPARVPAIGEHQVAVGPALGPRSAPARPRRPRTCQPVARAAGSGRAAAHCRARRQDDLRARVERRIGQAGSGIRHRPAPAPCSTRYARGSASRRSYSFTSKKSRRSIRPSGVIGNAIWRPSSIRFSARTLSTGVALVLTISRAATRWRGNSTSAIQSAGRVGAARAPGLDPLQVRRLLRPPALGAVALPTTSGTSVELASPARRGQPKRADAARRRCVTGPPSASTRSCRAS